VIDPLFFKSLDMAVDWAEKYQIYIILDNRPVGQPAVDNSYRIFLIFVWTQMAEHYKNRGEYVICEILNEPNGISAGNWGKMQGEVIYTIRKIDQNHLIVVSGIHIGNEPVQGLFSLPKYTDNKLLYTFHFYDPHIFTYHGATWGESLWRFVSGLPFSYDKSRMPRIPNEVKGTWVEYKLNNYSSTGTIAALTWKIGKVVNFIRQRNVPVFCGEFGVLIKNALSEDRLIYYQFVSEAHNIPWIT
jgi:endoglucanase